MDALRDLGKTVLLTTHYMDEAEHLANRVAVISAGQLVAIGSPDELRDSARGSTVISFRLPGNASPADLPAVDGAVHLDDHTLRIDSAHPTQDTNTLTGWALRRGVELDSLRLSRPSLEEVYLQLTGPRPVMTDTSPTRSPRRPAPGAGPDRCRCCSANAGTTPADSSGCRWRRSSR